MKGCIIVLDLVYEASRLARPDGFGRS